MQVLEKNIIKGFLNNIYKTNKPEELSIIMKWIDSVKFITLSNLTKFLEETFPQLNRGIHHKELRWKTQEINDNKENSLYLNALINKTKYYNNIKKKENKGKFPEGCRIIYQVVTGSQSFGLSTPTSDVDIKGVYVQDNWKHGMFESDGYVSSVTINKDEIYFEIKRFLELLIKGEALALEMLFNPKDCIVYMDKRFEFLRKHKDRFITKKLYFTFINYAMGQFKKATNYNKKANWSDEKIRRKSPSEFTMFYHKNSGSTSKFNEYLKQMNINEEDITLTKMDGFPNTYKVYVYKTRGWFTDKSNELRTGEIPIELKENYVGLVMFNHSEYSKHCKEYHEYQQWLKNRSDERYNTNKEHAQNYDSKNIMHTVRLIMTASEIPIKKTIVVDRTENRGYLLSIKNGTLDLKYILDKWLAIGENQKEIFEQSDLPDEPDFELSTNFLKSIRLNIKNPLL